MVLELTFIFFSAFAILFVMRKIAKRIGLVDKPNARKLHQGQCPWLAVSQLVLLFPSF